MEKPDLSAFHSLNPNYINCYISMTSGFYPYTWWAQLAPSEK